MRNTAKAIAVLLAVLALGGPPASAQSIKVFEKQCPKGQRADAFPAWEFIANNARRTADEYAVNNNPSATFVTAEANIYFQAAGEYAGEYIVQLVGHVGHNVSFARLRPKFNFCGDPGGLDDERTDLFEITLAKFNGIPF